MNTEAIEQAITAAATPEAMLQVRESVLALEQRAGMLRKRIDDAMTEHLEAGGRIEGWYLADEKKTKCLNVVKAFNAIAMKDTGDGQAIESCLSANAIKHGAAKAVLGDEWCKHFIIIESKRLTEGEPPKKKLTHVSTFKR